MNKALCDDYKKLTEIERSELDYSSSVKKSMMSCSVLPLTIAAVFIHTNCLNLHIKLTIFPQTLIIFAVKFEYAYAKYPCNRSGPFCFLSY